MISNQIIQNCIDEIQEISKIELYVADSLGNPVAKTKNMDETDCAVILSFIKSDAQSQEVKGQLLFKVFEDGMANYVLAANGGDESYLVGKLATNQLKNLIVAYKDRVDKNSFFQNLLLDNLLLVDIYNRAQKLHIEAVQRRCVFVVETTTEKDVNAMEMVKELFYSQSGDFVTAVDEKNIILIKSLEEGESEEILDETARVLVDMLNTEAMTNVRVAYGTVVEEIKGVSKSYKEAKMALDVGKIFYMEKSIIAYDTLGIGRLIFQLPMNLCQIFVNEIFKEVKPENIDDELLMTANKFFENNLNVSETSRQLYIHRNTLVYRIEKLQKATGLDIRVFDDALTLKIALMVVNYMKYISELE